MNPIPALAATGVSKDATDPRKDPNPNTHLPPIFSARIPPKICVAIFP